MTELDLPETVKADTSVESACASDAEVSAQPLLLPTGLFLVLAAEAAAFAALLSIYMVIRVTYPDLFSPARPVVELSAGVMQIIVLVLAALSIVGVGYSLRFRLRTPALCFLTATIMYGLVFLGALAVERVQRHDSQESVSLAMAELEAQSDTSLAAAGSEFDAVAASAPPVQASAVVGDAVNGAKLFGVTCSGCHGQQGVGVDGAAPALRDTPFMLGATASQLVAVTKQGRAPGAPDNKTGKAMPALGGNPFLSDSDVSDIVAYLLKINDPAAGSDGDAELATAGVDPQSLVPRWVVGAAAPAKTGVEPEAYARLDQRHAHAVSLNLLVAGFAGLQAFHVLIGLVVVTWLLVQIREGRLRKSLLPTRRMVHAWWLAGAVAWLIAFPILYMLP